MEQFYDLVEGPRELSPGRRNPVSKVHLFKSHDYLMLTRWLAAPMLALAFDNSTDEYKGVAAATRAMNTLTQYDPDVRADWRRKEQRRQVFDAFALLEQALPGTERCMMWHAATHLTDQQWRFGGAHLTWMFHFDSFLGYFKRFVTSKSHPEANLMHSWRTAIFSRVTTTRFVTPPSLDLVEESSSSSAEDDEDARAPCGDAPPRHIYRPKAKPPLGRTPGITFRAPSGDRWRGTIRLDGATRRSIAALLHCPASGIPHRVKTLSSVTIDGVRRGSYTGTCQKAKVASRCGKPRSIANSEFMLHSPPHLANATQYGKIFRFYLVHEEVIAAVVVYAKAPAGHGLSRELTLVIPPADVGASDLIFIRWQHIGRQIAFAPAPGNLVCVVHTHYPLHAREKA